MLRLVFGLGTRAVDRSDDDYTRVVALNAPDKRTEASFDEVRQYAQRKVDVLNLQANQLVSNRFSEVAAESPDLPIEVFASRDSVLGGQPTAPPGSAAAFPWVLTFEHLLSRTDFVRDMREMLRTLQEAYDFPVDVEFTANFMDDGKYKINLVQCRPLSLKCGTQIAPVAEIPKADLILEAHGAVIGQSRALPLDRIIYVVPAAYGNLPVSDRHTVARLIGRLAHLDSAEARGATMLLGPGRWGTTTPSLGVPATFSDISTVSVLCEIVAMRDDLVPDVSLGTHYFSDLVESDILYLALFPNRQGNFLSQPFFEHSPNKLPQLLPDAGEWAHVIRVIDTADVAAGKDVILYANSLKQQVFCYFQARAE
jgi:hypothetical protein